MSADELKEALKKLVKDAGEVSRLGAVTGGQWVRLSASIISARALLDRLAGGGMKAEEPYQKFSRLRREKLEKALTLPLPTCSDDIGTEGIFDPWEHVIHGIYGGYSSESDDLMIETLEAVRDRKTFELIENKGFVIEFMLYVLAGHGLTEYGTSPRGGFPDQSDLWQPLIDKWKAYRDVAWGDD